VRVSGKLTPEIVKPDPLTAAALMVTEAVPVELNVSDCVVAVFTATVPNDKLLELTPSVETFAPSDNEKVSSSPPAFAVSVATWADPTAATVAVKDALEAPAATVTEDGTTTDELLLVKATANPPLAAAAFNVTVQLSVPAPVIEPLVQLKPVNVGLTDASVKL